MSEAPLETSRKRSPGFREEARSQMLGRGERSRHKPQAPAGAGADIRPAGAQGVRLRGPLPRQPPPRSTADSAGLRMPAGTCLQRGAEPIESAGQDRPVRRTCVAGDPRQGWSPQTTIDAKPQRQPLRQGLHSSLPCHRC